MAHSINTSPDECNPIVQQTAAKFNLVNFILICLSLFGLNNISFCHIRTHSMYFSLFISDTCSYRSNNHS